MFFVPVPCYGPVLRNQVWPRCLMHSAKIRLSPVPLGTPPKNTCPALSLEPGRVYEDIVVLAAARWWRRSWSWFQRVWLEEWLLNEVVITSISPAYHQYIIWTSISAVYHKYITSISQNGRWEECRTERAQRQRSLRRVLRLQHDYHNAAVRWGGNDWDLHPLLLHWIKLQPHTRQTWNTKPLGLKANIPNSRQSLWLAIKTITFRQQPTTTTADWIGVKPTRTTMGALREVWSLLHLHRRGGLVHQTQKWEGCCHLACQYVHPSSALFAQNWADHDILIHGTLWVRIEQLHATV